MMPTLRVLIAAAAAVFFLGCSSTRIQTDFDRQANFSSYSSFAWYQVTDQNKRPTDVPSQIVDGRIRRAIEDNLRLKGFSQGESGEADLLVTYYTSLSSQMQFHTTGWGYGWGGGPYWRFGYGYWPGWTSTTVHTYHEGTVIIDIIDRGKNQLVWRGITTRVLNKKSHSDEEIERSMTRVLFDFPPA